MFGAKPAPVVVNNPFARPADNPIFKKIEPVEQKPVVAAAPINIFSKPIETKPANDPFLLFSKPAATP